MKLKLLIILTFYLQKNAKVTAQTASCKYGDEWFYDYAIDKEWTPLYTCIMKVTQSNLYDRFKTITGVHEDGSTDRDVKHLNIGDENKFKIFSASSCLKFSNLKAISTNNVKLESLDADSLSNCQQLENLSLNGNEIPRLPEDLLKNNRKLTYVNFEKCSLTALPENLFINQQQLLKLSLIDNELTSLPSNIFRPLVKLQTLDLDSNKLQIIDPNWFETLKNLKWLDFDGNKIFEIPSKAFVKSPNLKSLYFNNNNVKTLQPECFDGLQNLQELGIPSNHLFDLPAKVFEPLKNLYKLELNANKLTTIHSDCFGVHNNLSEIYLQDNLLKSLDINLMDITAITDINMENNNCSKVWLKKASKDDIKGSLKICFDSYIPRDKLQYNPKTSCGRLIAGRGNIVGGLRIPRGASPWYAALTKRVEGEFKFFCGGNLISKRKIVTAAHCYHEKRMPEPNFTTSNLKILLGAYDLSLLEENGRVEYTAQSIHVHPDWIPNSANYDADITVLVLSKDVEFTDNIQRVCLCTPDLPVAKDLNGFAVGYGASEDTTKPHETLPKIIYTPIHNDNEVCFYKDKNLLTLSSKRTFCGGTGNGTGVCRGDSGGGIFVYDGYLFYLRGVVSASLISYPYGCDVNTYAVFTDVTKYIDWINEIEIEESFHQSDIHYLQRSLE